ncbi:MAG TPA: arylamine N-acetyltransferase [Thermoanaerobaculia bacterium]
MTPSVPIPVDDILEALDLSRAEPGTGFLEALLDRFNARVPFETATKILRSAQSLPPEEKPRWPDVFWTDHLEKGAGGTCFARVAAFGALLSALRFRCRTVLGRVERDFDHASLLVEDRHGLWICDAGFPLPALVPARASEVETELGRLGVEETARGFRVQFLEGVPEGPRSLEIFTRELSTGEYDGHWRATFRADSRFLAAVAVRSQTRGRVVSFAGGEVRVDDRHTRLVVPLVDERSRRVSDLFGIDRDLLDQAFAIVGDPPPERADARLSAFLPYEGTPQQAFDALATPSAYRRLLDGVARVESEEAAADGWRFRLAPPTSSRGAAELSPLAEEVTPSPDRFELGVRRQSGPTRSETFFRAETRQGETFLVREAVFSGAREDLLVHDALRGRLAGALAVDLLAWARLLRADLPKEIG